MALDQVRGDFVEAPTRAAVALRVTIMIGQTGRYFEMRRADWPLFRRQSSPTRTVSRIDKIAHLVVRTRIAPALSSKLALTADWAVDSTRLTGRLTVSRNSLNRLTYGMATSAS